MNINTDEEKYLLKEQRHARDKYNMVYVIIFITGVGVLMPWNFFITVKPYFLDKLSDNHTSGNTNLQNKFINYLALASMIPVCLINVLNLILRRHIVPMKRFIAGVFVMFLMFLVTVILTQVSIEINLFFIITMISVVILNACSGIIQGSSLGIVSMMPARYIKGYMEGQAMSGLIAAVANIISISVVGKLSTSAFIYFFLALIIMIITAFGFGMLGRMKFSRNYVILSNQMDKYTQEIDSTTSTEDSLPSVSVTGNISFREKYVPIIKTIYWEGISVGMVFCVTLSLFPAIPSQIVTISDNVKWNCYDFYNVTLLTYLYISVYFSPVTCFLFYNLADYFGRFLCGFFKFPSENHPKLLFALTMLRWIFVPLFFMCNIPNRRHFPKVLTHDAYPIILTLLFGLTNGYLITLPLIYAPSKVGDKDKETVGTLMSFFMCIGLAVGVGISFTYLYII